MFSKEYINDLKIKGLQNASERREYFFSHPELKRLYFELTLQCNEHCFHCGSSCDAHLSQVMPKEKYIRVLDDVKKNISSNIMICITGGEPLLYPEFFELMRAVKERGFPWGMTTNATLITKDTAKKLKETGMETVSVSIDGLPETHDRLRGRKNAFRDAMNGIQNLINLHCFPKIQITSVINHENIGELDALYELMKSVDITSWRLIGLEPMGRALNHPEKMLTKEDHQRLLSFIKEKRENQMPVTYGCAHFLGLDFEREVRDWFFLCNAGIHTAGIAANGDILACLDIERRPELIQGNIEYDLFSDTWKNKYQIFRRRLSSLNEDCKNCQWEKFCFGGSFHSWDFDKNEPRICMKDILF